MYPEDLVVPMRKELTDAGFKELINSEDVNAIIEKKKPRSFWLILFVVVLLQMLGQEQYRVLIMTRLP